MDFNYNDGGRVKAGFNGSAGDCVVRAISIATGLPYKKVYDDLFEASKTYSKTHRCKVAKHLKNNSATPRDGVFPKVYEPYLESLGWTWVALSGIGTGCKMHLHKDEVPSGTIIVRLSKHLATVIDGTLHDTYDCSRNGTRCVYGYWKKNE